MRRLPLFFFNRAACFSRLRHFDKAIEETSAAVELRPNYQNFTALRATANGKLEQVADSLFDYNAWILSDVKSHYFFFEEKKKRVLRSLRDLLIKSG